MHTVGLLINEPRGRCMEIKGAAMENEHHFRGQSGTWLVVIGTLTLLVLFLAFLAFHDIGVGETDPRAEYGVLVVGGAWMLFVAGWLFRTGRGVLSALSILALAGLAWGTRYGALTTPPRVGAWAVAAAGFVWIVVLSGILLRDGRRVARLSDD